MNDQRKIIFTVATPLPEMSQVTLYADTWHDHIVKNHVYMAGKEKLVEATVLNPTVITVGTSNPGYRVFVNQGETTPSGTPLVVIADPKGQLICTALYNRSFKIINPEEIVWSSPVIK